MKQEFNVTGKSVDEAYRKAVELYSVMGDISLEEVVNPGKKGFLGLFGAVDAEIRISVDDGMPERKPKNKKPMAPSSRVMMTTKNTISRVLLLGASS